MLVVFFTSLGLDSVASRFFVNEGFLFTVVDLSFFPASPNQLFGRFD